MEKKKKTENLASASEHSGSDSSIKLEGKKAKLSLQRKNNVKSVMTVPEVDLNETEDFKDGGSFQKKAIIKGSRNKCERKESVHLSSNTKREKTVAKKKVTGSPTESDSEVDKKFGMGTKKGNSDADISDGKIYVHRRYEKVEPKRKAEAQPGLEARKNSMAEGESPSGLMSAGTGTRSETEQTKKSKSLTSRFGRTTKDKLQHDRDDEGKPPRMLGQEVEIKKMQRKKVQEESVFGVSFADEKVDDSLYLCQICQKDLSNTDAMSRAEHVNNCIDQIESKKTVPPSGPVVLDCPMCGKLLKTEASRKVHLKKCARMLGVTTDQMMTAVRAQEQQQKQHQATETVTHKTVQAKKTTSAQARKKKAKIPDDEATQLAMALSSSLAEEERKREKELISQLNLRGIGENTDKPTTTEGKKTRKKKGGQPAPTPLLLQLTKEESHSRIAQRVTQFIGTEIPEYGFDLTPPSSRETRLDNLPGTTLLHYTTVKDKHQGKLWAMTSLTEQTETRSAYYTQALMPPVSMSNMVVGSKLRRLSQIPGRRKSAEERNTEPEVECDDEASPATPIIASTPTAVVLAELAADTQNESTSTANIISGIEVDEDDVMREASGFCPDQMPLVKEDTGSPGLLHMQREYLRMVDNPNHSDVTIVTENKCNINAHQVILCARCPKMLELTEDGVISLPETSKEAMLSLLKFIYAGSVQLQHGFLSEIRDLSLRFDIQELLKSCDAEIDEREQAAEDIEKKEKKRRQSMDDMFKEMLSDEDFVLDPINQENEKGETVHHSDEDEDDWREIYLSQRQQLHRRKSLEISQDRDDRLSGSEMTRDETMREDDNCNDRKQNAGLTETETFSQHEDSLKEEEMETDQGKMTCGEEELFPSEDELSQGLLLAVDSSDNDDNNQKEPDEATCRLGNGSYFQGEDMVKSGMGQKDSENSKTNSKTESDEFVIIKSGTSTSEDEEDGEGSRDLLQSDESRESFEKGQSDKDKKSKHEKQNPEYSLHSASESLKRKKPESDVLNSPIFRKQSSRRGPSSQTPEALSSRKRVRLGTPSSAGSNRDCMNDANKMSTPVDKFSLSSNRSSSVVTEDSLYITPIPKERQRSTFMFVTPDSHADSNVTNSDGEYVAFPVGKIALNKDGQEGIVSLDSVELDKLYSVSKRSVAGGDHGSGTDGEGDVSPVIPNTDISHLSESVSRSGAPVAVDPDGIRENLSKHSRLDSDSDVEITSDNLQLVAELSNSLSPKFKSVCSLKKISSEKSSQRHSLILSRSSTQSVATDVSGNREEPLDNCGSPGVPDDVWEGIDDIDAGCEFEPFCDADTEESPSKMTPKHLGSSQKKKYTHKRRISLEDSASKTAGAYVMSNKKTLDTQRKEEFEDDDTLPSPEQIEPGETTTDFDIPGGDSFLWNEDNVPTVDTSLSQISNNKTTDVNNFKTPITQRPSKPRKKWIPPSPFTPMPKYDEMNTPQLKKEVSKFGVRPVGKKRMKILLKDIYHQTHQYETDSDYEPSPTKKQPAPSVTSPFKSNKGRQIARGSSGMARTTSKTGNVAAAAAGSDTSASEDGSSQRSVTSSQESGCSDVPEESILLDEDDLSASQQGNQIDFNTKMLQFVRNRPDIHTRMMMYEPLELDWLKKEVQGSGIKCSMQKLMDFLDEKCLTFTMKKMSKRNTNRRQPRKKKKKIAVPEAAV